MARRFGTSNSEMAGTRASLSSVTGMEPVLTSLGSIFEDLPSFT